MKSNTYHSSRLTPFPQISLVLLSLIFLTTPTIMLAHGGHGNEFKNEESAQPTGGIKVDAGGIKVDGETATRLGIKLERVTRQRLVVGIKTTGQIETLPNQKVEVTAQIPGKVVKILVKNI